MSALPITQPAGASTAKAGHTNSLFGVASRAVSGFSRSGILLLIAVKYGPELFGKLALAIALTEIFRTFSEFGIDTIAIRRFSLESPEQRERLLDQVVTSKLVAASVGYAISLLVLALMAHDRTTLAFGIIAGLSLFTANLVGAFSSYYQSQLEMATAFPASLISYFIYIALCLSTVFAHASLLLVICLLPVCELLNFLLLYRRLSHRPALYFDLSATFLLFKESLPVGLMAVMTILCFRLDNMLVFRFLGSAALGLYAAAYRVVEPALMVPHAFSISLFAILATHQIMSQRQAARVVLHTMWPAYLFIASAAAILVFGGAPLLHRFGGGYAAIYPILRILSIVLFFRTINITLTAVLNSRGSYSVLAKITATTLTANALLALLLIRRLGIEGAAWAAFGTELWHMSALSLFTKLGSAASREPVYALVNAEPEIE
jgi:O-antigen/teichoic acid export membrane protein